MSKLVAVIAVSLLLMVGGVAGAVPRPNGRRAEPPPSFVVAHAHDPQWLKFEAHQWWVAVVTYAAAVEKAESHPWPAWFHPGDCGGVLPTCSIMWCESRGDIRAQNPRSSASGKWQVTSGTWADFDGFGAARLAPEWVQDVRAAQIWDGGAGRSQWVC